MKHQVVKNQTLFQALRNFFPESSNRTLKQWIAFGRVFVDEMVISSPQALLLQGQILSIKSKEIPGPFPVLYHDRWLIVINKPSGLLSVPDKSLENNALELLRENFRTRSIYAVHRIDQETSGVLLFARGKQSEEKFHKMFEIHAVQREYAAILEGHLSERKGTWESFLKEKENYDVVSTFEGDGKKAITHYEVLRYSPKFTYVRFNLETGKKHQIRVQSADVGHAIVGDFRYGAIADPIKRMCLHAHKLQFLHPFTGKEMTLYAELPKGFFTLGFPKN